MRSITYIYTCIQQLIFINSGFTGIPQVSCHCTGLLLGALPLGAESQIRASDRGLSGFWSERLLRQNYSVLLLSRPSPSYKKRPPPRRPKPIGSRLPPWLLCNLPSCQTLKNSPGGFWTTQKQDALLKDGARLNLLAYV